MNSLNSREKKKKSGLDKASARPVPYRYTAVILAGIAVLFLSRSEQSKIDIGIERKNAAAAEQQETQPESAASVSYKIEEPGKVSAAVYDGEGRLVRELLRGEMQEAGEHTLTWDGLDRYGNPQPPGEYELRVLRTQEFTAEFLFQLGVRPTSARHHRWVGNHRGVTQLASDASGLYLGARIAEGAPPGLLKQSLDGAVRYWSQQVRPALNGPVALASDGQGRLYWMRYDGKVKIVDSETGDGGGEFFGGGRKEMDWDLLPEGAERPDRHGQPGLDLAASGDVVIVADHERDAVRWLDTQTGEASATVEVASPRSIAVGPNETAWVVSDGKVLRVSPEGEITPLVENLPNPQHVANDTERSHLLVATGEPDHRVHRYTPAGEWVRSYGREGGRQQGAYVATDLLHIDDLVATGDGGFVVAEGTKSLRRVVHLDAAGQVVNEWPGPQPFRSHIFADPRDPSGVWYAEGDRWLIRAALDYDQGNWSILETYNLDDIGGGLVMPPPRTSSWKVVYHDNERYLVSATPLPTVLHHRPGRLRAVVASGPIDGEYGRRLTEALGHGLNDNGKSYVWTDSNNDGIIDESEVVVTDIPIPAWPSCDVGSDFSIAYLRNESTEDGHNGLVLRRLSVSRWDGPIPHYDVSYPLGERIGQGPPGHMEGRGAAYIADDGAIYGIYNWGQRHGEFFPSDKSGAHNRVAAWSPGGQLQWSIGRHDARTNTRYYDSRKPDGYFHAPYDITGIINGSVIVNDWMETPAMAWTHDGLYAGHFLADRVDDGLPGTAYEWWLASDTLEPSIINRDCAYRGAILQRDNGEVIWFAPGTNSAPVYRIHGWEGWERVEQRFSLDTILPHATAKGEGLQAAYYPNLEFAGTPAAEHVQGPLWFGTAWRDGGHKIIDGMPWPRHRWGENPAGITPGDGVTVRWVGEIEAPLSETFRFSTYARGGVRLWIDGRQVLHGWNEIRERRESIPIKLAAGERYPIRVDFYSTAELPALSLNWESESLDRTRVPRRYLYAPVNGDQPLTRPGVRNATRPIEADSFDMRRGEARWDVFNWARIVRRNLTGLVGRGDYVGYERIDFGQGMTEFKISASSDPETRLSLRLDAPDGPAIATIEPDMNFDEERFDVDQIEGVHDLYLVNETGGRMRLRYFSFQ